MPEVDRQGIGVEGEEVGLQEVEELEALPLRLTRMIALGMRTCVEAAVGIAGVLGLRNAEVGLRAERCQEKIVEIAVGIAGALGIVGKEKVALRKEVGLAIGIAGVLGLLGMKKE